MQFEILEIDRDYRTVTGIEMREFEGREAAEEWCRAESWTGYDYRVNQQNTQKGEMK